MADDLNFQQISTVQNELQPEPVTIPAATTIAPSTFLTFVTGNTAVVNITPPVTGCHMLALVFTATNGTITGGTTQNGVAEDIVPLQNTPVLLVYDPLTKRYYGGGLSTTPA